MRLPHNKITHAHIHSPYIVIVRDRLEVKAGAVPNSLFDRQLKRISRNNRALNLCLVPRGVPLPKRSTEVRGRRFSLIYVVEAQALA